MAVQQSTPNIPKVEVANLHQEAQRRIEHLDNLPWHCPWAGHPVPVQDTKIWVVISNDGGYPIGATFPTEADADAFQRPATWTDEEWDARKKVVFPLPKNPDPERVDAQRAMVMPMWHEWFTPFEPMFPEPIPHSLVDHWELHAVLQGGKKLVGIASTNVDAVILNKNGMHSLGYPLYRSYGPAVEAKQRSADTEAFVNGGRMGPDDEGIYHKGKRVGDVE